MEATVQEAIENGKIFFATVVEKIQAKHPTALFGIGALVIVFLLAVSRVGGKPSLSGDSDGDGASRPVSSKKRQRVKAAKAAKASKNEDTRNTKQQPKSTPRTTPEPAEDESKEDSVAESRLSSDTEIVEPPKETWMPLPVTSQVAQPKKKKTNKKKPAPAPAAAAKPKKAPVPTTVPLTTDTTPVDDDGGGWIRVPERRRRANVDVDPSKIARSGLTLA